MRRSFVLTTGILLILAGPAGADPPAMRYIYPPAAQPGVETRLQVLGKDLGSGLKLVLPFAGEVRLDSSSSEQAFFVMKPGKDVAAGVYPVRVRSADGASNMILFAITDLKVVREVEPNGRLEQAQRLDWPCMIAGSIGGTGAPHPSKDLDVYRFTVKAGQRLTFVAEARRLGMTPDLFIRLRNAKGRDLAECDDTPGLGVDPRLDYTFAEAGDYFLEVHLTHFTWGGRNLNYLLKVGPFDYASTVFPLGGRRGEKLRLSVTGRDGQTTVLDTRVPGDARAENWLQPLTNHPGSLPWRLAIGDLPEVFEDAERSGPQSVKWPVTINGRIARPNEVDRYRFAVEPGQKVRARVDAFDQGSPLDGVLRAYDPEGKLLGVSPPRRSRILIDPLLDFVVPEKVREVTVTLEDSFGRAGLEFAYRLTVEPGGPDFELMLGADFPRDGNAQNDVLHLPVGAAVALPVRVLRRGYEGEIKLTVLDPPTGVSVKAGVIPAGKNIGEITVMASPQATDALFKLSLSGEAHSEGQTLKRNALRPLHLGEPYYTNLPWNWRLTRVVCCKLPERSDK